MTRRLSLETSDFTVERDECGRVTIFFSDFSGSDDIELDLHPGVAMDLLVELSQNVGEA